VAPFWSEIFDLDALTAAAHEIRIKDLSDDNTRIAQRFVTAMENRERDRRGDGEI
jgi:hypothetical protein